MNKIFSLKAITFLIIFCAGVFTTQAQEFKRNIQVATFIPKGQWIIGSSVSYSEHSEGNYQFLVIEGVDANGYKFKITPLLAYAIKDDLAIGGRFSYSRSLTQLDGASISLDSETEFDVNDLYQLKHSYSAIAILRNYISLGQSKRFALFNEVQLEFGGSQGKMISGLTGNSLTGTYTKSTDFGIGLSPGLVAFINNYTAVEVSVGVLGFNFSKNYDTKDQIYQGEQSKSSANFKINLFSIGLGISFYI